MARLGMVLVALFAVGCGTYTGERRAARRECVKVVGSNLCRPLAPVRATGLHQGEQRPEVVVRKEQK